MSNKGHGKKKGAFSIGFKRMDQMEKERKRNLQRSRHCRKRKRKKGPVLETGAVLLAEKKESKEDRFLEEKRKARARKPKVSASTVCRERKRGRTKELRENHSGRGKDFPRKPNAPIRSHRDTEREESDPGEGKKKTSTGASSPHPKGNLNKASRTYYLKRRKRRIYQLFTERKKKKRDVSYFLSRKGGERKEHLLSLSIYVL